MNNYSQGCGQAAQGIPILKHPTKQQVQDPRCRPAEAPRHPNAPRRNVPTLI